MSFDIDRELMDLVEEVLSRMVLGGRPEIENKKYKVRAYLVKGLPKYAKPLIRVDIQDLELRDYS